MLSYKKSFYLAYFFLPIIMYLDLSTSFMLGTLLLCLISFSASKLSKENLISFYKVLICGILLFLLNFLMMLFTNSVYDLYRFFLSILMMFLIIISGFYLYDKFKSMKDLVINNMLNTGYYIYVMIAVLSFIPFVQFNISHSKSVLPFNEPSHFAIYLTPIILYKVYVSYHSYLYVLPFIIFAIFVQNFTLLIVLVLSLFIRFKLKTLIFIPLLLAYILYLGIDLTYFSNRLNFSAANDNLSLLVYQQGLDIIQYSFTNLRGLGMGFQQLGFNGVYFDTTERLRFLLDKDMNLTDGGFTAAKIIGEFGILGIFILGYYFKFLILSFKILFAKVEDLKMILSAIFIVSYVIELFVRGIGYFNVSLVFLICAILYIKYNYKSANENNLR